MSVLRIFPPLLFAVAIVLVLGSEWLEARAQDDTRRHRARAGRVIAFSTLYLSLLSSILVRFL